MKKEGLVPEEAVVVVVDVQGKLATLMHETERLMEQLQIFLRGARVLELPILWLEQYPKGLGPTVPEVAELLEGLEPIDKTCFSGYGSDRFRKALEATGRRQVIVVGIECHVCVYQTVRDLLADGYGVEVVADAVSSRTAANRHIGLERMARLGAGIMSVEMVLFELLREAGSEAFKEISRLVR